MMLMLNLPPELETKLAAEADKLGVPLPDYALQVLERAVKEGPTEQAAGDYLLQLAERVRALVPEEERAQVPSDLAINHDHYLYGAPKADE